MRVGLYAYFHHIPLSYYVLRPYTQSASSSIIFSRDIKAGIKTAVVMVILGALFSIWAGIQSIRSGRKLDYFRLRQKRIALGWRLFVLAVFLAGAAFWLENYGEPVAYQYYPPSPMPSLSPTITLTPTITPTPTITLTPTISNTPSVSDTPTITPTPFLPLEIQPA